MNGTNTEMPKQPSALLVEEGIPLTTPEGAEGYNSSTPDDLIEAMARVEDQGGIEAHKNRYGGDISRCPVAGSLGATATAKLEENMRAREATPHKSRTYKERMAEKRQKQEASRPEDTVEVKPETIINESANTTKPMQSRVIQPDHIIGTQKLTEEAPVLEQPVKVVETKKPPAVPKHSRAIPEEIIKTDMTHRQELLEENISVRHIVQELTAPQAREEDTILPVLERSASPAEAAIVETPDSTRPGREIQINLTQTELPASVSVLNEIPLITAIPDRIFKDSSKGAELTGSTIAIEVAHDEMEDALVQVEQPWLTPVNEAAQFNTESTPIVATELMSAERQLSPSESYAQTPLGNEISDAIPSPQLAENVLPADEVYQPSESIPAQIFEAVSQPSSDELLITNTEIAKFLDTSVLTGEETAVNSDNDQSDIPPFMRGQTQSRPAESLSPAAFAEHNNTATTREIFAVLKDLNQNFVDIRNPQIVMPGAAQELEILCSRLFEALEITASKTVIRGVMKDVLSVSNEHEAFILNEKRLNGLNNLGTHEYRAFLVTTLQTHFWKLIHDRTVRFGELSKYILHRLSEPQYVPQKA